MNDKLPPHVTEYQGATGPSRVPLREAVWAVLLGLRRTDQSRTSVFATQLPLEAQLSSENIEALRDYVERATEDISRDCRSRIRALCRDRAKYQDRAMLGEALALLDRHERGLRDQYLRRLREVLTRSEIRRLLAWIASDGRAHMGMHVIDHRLYVQSVDTVDKILDRLCKGATP